MFNTLVERLINTRIYHTMEISKVLCFCSHPKYKQALNKKFPSLVCGTPDAPTSTSDGTSVASCATNVTEDKSAAA